MRRVLHTFVFLIIVISSSVVPVIATEKMTSFEERNLNVLWLKLAIMKDGKRIGDKLVNYGIYKVKGKWEGYWIQASFYKPPAGKSTSCYLYHFSTKEGTLKNINVTDKTMTFDLEPSPSVAYESARVFITPPGKDYPFTPTVKVTAIDPNGVEEWVITERIILPYPEISGVPDPDKKWR